MNQPRNSRDFVRAVTNSGRREEVAVRRLSQRSCSPSRRRKSTRRDVESPSPRRRRVLLGTGVVAHKPHVISKNRKLHIYRKLPDCHIYPSCRSTRRNLSDVKRDQTLRTCTSLMRNANSKRRRHAHSKTEASRQVERRRNSLVEGTGNGKTTKKRGSTLPSSSHRESQRRDTLKRSSSTPPWWIRTLFAEGAREVRTSKLLNSTRSNQTRIISIANTTLWCSCEDTHAGMDAFFLPPGDINFCVRFVLEGTRLRQVLWGREDLDLLVEPPPLHIRASRKSGRPRWLLRNDAGPLSAVPERVVLFEEGGIWYFETESGSARCSLTLRAADGTVTSYQLPDLVVTYVSERRRPVTTEKRSTFKWTSQACRPLSTKNSLSVSVVRKKTYW